MLKTILGLNPLREGDLSKTALMRARISSVFALLVVPLTTLIDHHLDLSTLSLSIKLVCSIIMMMCLIPFAYNRVFSIFVRSIKNLDEWEVLARREAESFTYRVVGCMSFIALVALTLLDERGLIEITTLPIDSVLPIIINLLFLSLILPAAYIVWTRTPLDEG